MMGGAVKRYEAAAYDERQPAPPPFIGPTIMTFILSLNK